jgi:hypothetical protein
MRGTSHLPSGNIDVDTAMVGINYLFDRSVPQLADVKWRAFRADDWSNPGAEYDP